MTDSSSPLLPRAGGTRHDSECIDDSPEAVGITRRLEEGLSMEDIVDFEDLLRQRPDTVISFLADHGTKKLGSFITEDVEVLPLMQSGTLWTLGSRTMDIDHVRVWEHRLANDHYKAKGFASKVEVEAHVVALRHATLNDDRGILNPLLGKWLDGSISTKVFGLPAVHAVITFKWNTWAARFIFYEFISYMVWVIGFQGFIFLFQDENLNLSLYQLCHKTRGILTIVAAVLAFVGMLPFVFIEGCTLVEYGFKRWLSVWNCMDIVTYALQIVITVMYFARWQLKSDALSIIAAIQVLLLWWKVQYFARAFQQMRNTFLNTIVTVIRDVRWFLLLLLVTLWGFAGAYYILYRDEQSTDKFDTPWRAMMTTFAILMGDVDTELFYSSKKPLVGCLILVVFLVLMVMVLLNLLIAIMSDSAARASDDDGTKFLCSKAELIDELESSLPSWLRQDHWYPEYVHFLSANPQEKDKNLKGKLWTLSKGGSDEGMEDDSKDSDAMMEMQMAMDGMRSEFKQLVLALNNKNGSHGSADSTTTDRNSKPGLVSTAFSTVTGLLPGKATSTA